MAEMKTGQKAEPPLVLRRHDTVRYQGYGSDIKPKVHHVPVLHHVLFALNP